MIAESGAFIGAMLTDLFTALAAVPWWMTVGMCAALIVAILGYALGSPR